MELFKLLRDWRRNRRDSFVRGQVYLGIEFESWVKYLFFSDGILINNNNGGLERSTIDGLFANV